MGCFPGVAGWCSALRAAELQHVGQPTNTSLAKKLDSHFQTQKLISEGGDLYFLFAFQEMV